MMENWQVNISLIPSIAVILTSTNRMALGLTDEINLRLLQNLEAFKDILPLKIKQLKRLSLAIILMYLALALLVINALSGALEILEAAYANLLIIVAIVIFMIALIFKIQFSYHAYKIRQVQFLSFLK
jgi:cytochrome c oxidase subunit IV